MIKICTFTTGIKFREYSKVESLRKQVNQYKEIIQQIRGIIQEETK